MSRTVIIDPVTRIEGHAKISLHLVLFVLNLIVTQNYMTYFVSLNKF